jgi:hypothetical protein
MEELIVICNFIEDATKLNLVKKHCESELNSNESKMDFDRGMKEAYKQVLNIIEK